MATNRNFLLFGDGASEVKRTEEAHLFFVAVKLRGSDRLPQWLRMMTQFMSPDA